MPTVSLTLSRAGNGGGTITSAPSGIGCPVTCAAGFAPGTRVTLTAQADVGSSFGGWSGGGGSGTATCIVTLGANTGVTATFIRQFFNLTVTTSGPGSITSIPAGINCGPTCTAGYAPQTVVTLTAVAGAWATFTGWSGACSGAAAICTTTMTAFRSVTAVRALHVTQMRTALIEVYQAAQRTPPTFSDATFAAAPVRAAHIAELRAAVLALP